MDAFAFLYRTERFSDIFGSAFCGPAVLEHGKETLVAKFEDKDDSDGQGVKVFCNSMPAMFFSVVAFDSKNTLGEPKKGFRVSFGSGCAEQAFSIAKLINEGMMSVYQSKMRAGECGNGQHRQTTRLVRNPFSVDAVIPAIAQ